MSVPLTLKVFKGEAMVAAKDYDRDIIKIGRLASAHLCLDDDKVSRIHSVIEVAPDGKLSIIDMGSVEGTWVNGKKVSKGALTFGDEIRVGNTLIKVEDGKTARAAAQAPAPAAAPARTNGNAGSAAAALSEAAHSAPVANVAPTIAPVAAAPAPAPVAPAPAAAPAPAPAAAPAPVAARVQIPPAHRLPSASGRASTPGYGRSGGRAPARWGWSSASAGATESSPSTCSARSTRASSRLATQPGWTSPSATRGWVGRPSPW